MADLIAAKLAAAKAIADKLKKRTRDPSSDELDPVEAAVQAALAGSVSNKQPRYEDMLATPNADGAYEEHIMIPNGIVGYVIGRGGENIKHIQGTTGAHMQIQKEHEMAPGSNLRRVTLIHTDHAAVTMAKALVVKMVDERCVCVCVCVYCMCVVICEPCSH